MSAAYWLGLFVAMFAADVLAFITCLIISSLLQDED